MGFGEVLAGCNYSVPANPYLLQTSDNGFIFGTNVWFIVPESPDHPGVNFYIEKLDTKGNLQWSEVIGKGGNGLTDLKEIGRNHYMLGGCSLYGISDNKTIRHLGGYDYWVAIVTDTTTKTITTNSIAATSRATKEIFIYPNPAKNILHVQTNGTATLSLTNQSGKVLLTKTINGKGEINVANLATGLYYLKNNATGVVQKVIVTK